MRNFAILRIEKHRSFGTIGASSKHTFRQQDTPNADPAKPIVKILGSGDIVADVKRRIAETSAKVICTGGKKDSVLSIEFLLTASPEYFRETPNGPWNKDRIRKWVRASQKWLKNEFGDNLVSSVLHLDETTPHLTAHVVPFNAGTGNLSARNIVGGRERLASIQDSYAEAVRDLGLARGIRKSKAQHQSIREWYAELAKPVARVPEIHVGSPPVLSRQQWATDIQQQLTATVAASMNTAVAQAVAAKTAMRRSHEFRKTALAKEAEIRRLSAERDWYRAQADKVRDFPLLNQGNQSGVVTMLGCERDKYDRAKFLTSRGWISITGEKFYNHELGIGGGGALDLVMHVMDCDYKTAVRWLSSETGPEVAAAAAAAKAYSDAKHDSVEEFSFKAPTPAPEHLSLVRDYLVKARKIPLTIVDWLIDKGAVYADRFKNVVMLYTNGNVATGAELRGTQSNFHGQAPGSRKKHGVFLLRGKNRNVAVVESAIDAMSYRSLHPSDWVIATGGVVSEHPIIDIFADQGFRLIAAHDRDKAGSQAASAMAIKYPGTERRSPPRGCKDWNDVISAVEKEDDPYPSLACTL